MPAELVLVDPELDTTTKLVWKAPISSAMLLRVCPRWSLAGASVLVPALMAGLLGSKAMVSVGPP